MISLPMIPSFLEVLKSFAEEVEIISLTVIQKRILEVLLSFTEEVGMISLPVIQKRILEVL